MSREGKTDYKIGTPLFEFDSCGSTNDIAKTLAEHNFPEGTSVISDVQTGGRGRYGRKWISPDGENIYLSVILRPKVKPKDISFFSIMGACAVSKTIESFSKGKVEIKWPNDVMIDGKKISGILSELKIQGTRLDNLVMGIGININSGLKNLNKKLKKTSTSLMLTEGKKVDRATFLAKLFLNLNAFYRFCARGSKSKTLKFANNRLFKRNCPVSFSTDGKKISGIIKGIDADGSIKISQNGKTRKFLSGEII